MEERDLSQQCSKILMAHLLTALDWLEYMTLFETYESCFPPFTIVPPQENPWNFTADISRLQQLMWNFMGIPEEDPMNFTMMLNVEDRWTAYYKERWAVFHVFLKKNPGPLLELSLEVQGLWLDADLPHPSQEITPSAEEGFHRLLKNLMIGAVSRNDFLARPADRAWKDEP